MSVYLNLRLTSFASSRGAAEMLLTIKLLEPARAGVSGSTAVDWSNKEVFRIFLGLTLISSLLIPGLASSQEPLPRPQSPANKEQNIYLSLRAFGLSVHLFDVSADAPFYPLKLDDKAVAVLNTGLALSKNRPTYAQEPHIYCSIPSCRT